MTDEDERRPGRAGLLVALLCQLGLSLAYVFATPAFEAPDEGDHLRYAFHLANARRLPVIVGTAARLGRPAGDELVQAYHPPLHYALLAATMVATGHADTGSSRLLNPVFGNWLDPQPAMFLRYLHGFDERPPRSPELRLLWLLRGWSVLFGLLSVGATWRLGRLAFPGRPAVADVAALLLACLPHWTYIHGAITNDVGAAALSHLALLVLATALARRRFGPGAALLLGALAGLAVLTKLTALFLGPLSLAAVAWMLLRWPEQRRRTALAALVALLTAAAVTAPFFLRNRALYGSLLALDVHEASFEGVHVPEGRLGEYLRHFFPEVFASLFGQFGWKVLPPEPAVLAGASALAAGALLGGLLFAARRPRGKPAARGAVVLLLALAAGAVYAATLRYNLTMQGPFGRYLFPALGAFAVLVAAGLTQLVQGLAARVRRVVGALLLPVPPAVAAWVLLVSFRPAFDVTLAPAPPHHASLAADLGTAPDVPRLRLVAPADGARLHEPPLLRWEPLDGAPAAGAGRVLPGDGAEPGGDEPPLFSVHAVGADGRLLFATYELTRFEIRAWEWRMPPEAFAFLPPGERVALKVRRVPDRSAGETVADVPGSGWLHVVRVEEG